MRAGRQGRGVRQVGGTLLPNHHTHTHTLPDPRGAGRGCREVVGRAGNGRRSGMIEVRWDGEGRR